MTANIASSKWDVLVVGAGPAGCASAITLAKLGWQVLLVETSVNPRFKLGESIAPIATSLVNSYLEPAPDNKPIFYKTSGNLSVWAKPNVETTDFYFTPSQAGLCLNRLAFEKELRNKAASLKVKISDKSRFVSCQRIKNTAYQWQIALTVKQIQTSIQAKFILDCSGRRAVVATELGVNKNQIDQLFAYANWYSTGEPDTDSYTRIEATPYGWWYSNRLPEAANINKRIVIFQTDKDLPAAKQAANKSGFQQLLSSSEFIWPFMVQNGYISTNDAIGGAPAHSQNLEQYCGIGWLAVGDAAQAYDPLSSQGIRKALDTASNAAYLTHYQLKKPDLWLQHNKYLDQYTVNQKILWDKYLKQRNYFYRQQKRWSECDFWQRRIT